MKRWCGDVIVKCTLEMQLATNLEIPSSNSVPLPLEYYTQPVYLTQLEGCLYCYTE